jgi:hypothetical protein
MDQQIFENNEARDFSYSLFCLFVDKNRMGKYFGNSGGNPNLAVGI